MARPAPTNSTAHLHRNLKVLSTVAAVGEHDDSTPLRCRQLAAARQLHQRVQRLRRLGPIHTVGAGAALHARQRRVEVLERQLRRPLLHLHWRGPGART